MNTGDCPTRVAHIMYSENWLVWRQWLSKLHWRHPSPLSSVMTNSDSSFIFLSSLARLVITIHTLYQYRRERKFIHQSRWRIWFRLGYKIDDGKISPHAMEKVSVIWFRFSVWLVVLSTARVDWTLCRGRWKNKIKFYINWMIWYWSKHVPLDGSRKIGSSSTHQLRSKSRIASDFTTDW